MSKPLKSLILTCWLAASAALFAPARAVGDSADAAALTDGEIRKVDKDAAKLTIRHGEIKNLDMPAMTMVFQVKDVALLDKVKAGDKVRFRAEKIADGYAVTAIEPVR